MPKKTPTKVVYRSAITGGFVSKQYADNHPKTTEKEHRPIGKRTPRKGK